MASISRYFKQQCSIIGFFFKSDGTSDDDDGWTSILINMYLFINYGRQITIEEYYINEIELKQH